MFPPKRTSQYVEMCDDEPLQHSFLDTWDNKFLPLIALSITTIVSTVLLCLSMTNWTSCDQLLRIQQTYSSVIPGIVQTTAEILSTLQLYALLSLINFATRIELCRSKSSLDTLKYRAAICLRRMDLSLPTWSMIIVFVLYLVSKVPAFLWADSITIVRTTSIDAHNLTLPILGADPFEQNNLVDGQLPNCWTLSSDLSLILGPYSSCPAQMFLSNLLQDASTATAKNHYRVDSVTALYTGRSYGLGAALGLTDTFFRSSDLDHNQPSFDEFSFLNPNLVEFEYPEDGFLTNVICKRNPTSTPDDWRIYPTQAGNEASNVPPIFEAAGNLADGKSYGFYSTWALKNDSQIVAWMATNNTNGSNSLSIAAGSDYIKLNNTQCSIVFTPTTFNVSVYTGSGTMGNITITPLDPQSFLPNNQTDADWHLRSLVLEQLTAISMIGTTLYGSVLGDALMANIGVCTVEADDYSDGQVLLCLEYSIQQIIDDLFVLLTAGQIVKQMSAMVNESEWNWPTDQFITAPVQGVWNAAQIGTRKYVVLTWWLNVAYLIVWGIEAYRLSLWKDLPAFNIMDLKSAILGSSTSGQSVAAAVEQVENERLQRPWTGESNDREAGRIEVQCVSTTARWGTKRIALDATVPALRSNRKGIHKWWPFHQWSEEEDTGTDEVERGRAKTPRWDMKSISWDASVPQRKSSKKGLRPLLLYPKKNKNGLAFGYL